MAPPLSSPAPGRWPVQGRAAPKAGSGAFFFGVAVLDWEKFMGKNHGDLEETMGKCMAKSPANGWVKNSF